MRKDVYLILMIFSLFFFSACENSDENVLASGQGKMMIDLRSDVSYKDKSGKARALDLTPFKDVNNYSVELSDGAGHVLWTKPYKGLPLTQEQQPGKYTLRAFYGENVPAGYDQLYVEGKKVFTLTEGDNQTVSLVCVPANVKVNLKFSDDFATYYSDCVVGFQTQHLSAPFQMTKADATKDLYLKADANEALSLTFDLKDKNGVSVTPPNFGAQKLTVQPRDFLTITVKPKLVNVEGGKINGITVTIDTGVTDEIVDVLLPDSFMPGQDQNVNN